MLVSIFRPEFTGIRGFTENEPPVRNYAPPQPIPEAGQGRDFDYVAAETANYLIDKAYGGRCDVFTMSAFNLLAEREFDNNDFISLLDEIWALIADEVYSRNVEPSNKLIGNAIVIGVKMLGACNIDSHFRDYDPDLEDSEVREMNKLLEYWNKVAPMIRGFKDRTFSFIDSSDRRGIDYDRSNLGNGLFKNANSGGGKQEPGYQSNSSISALRNKNVKEKREPTAPRETTRRDEPQSEPKVLKWNFSITQPYQTLFNPFEYRSALGTSKQIVVEKILPLTESEAMERNKHRTGSSITKRGSSTVRSGLKDLVDGLQKVNWVEVEALKDFNMTAPDKPLVLDKVVCTTTRDFMGFVQRMADWDVQSNDARMIMGKAVIAKSYSDRGSVHNKEFFTKICECTSLFDALDLFDEYQGLADANYLLLLNRRITDVVRNFIRCVLGMHNASFGNFFTDYKDFHDFMKAHNLLGGFNRFEGYLLSLAFNACEGEDLEVYRNMVFSEAEGDDYSVVSKTVGVIYLKYALDELEYEVEEGKPYLVDPEYNIILSKLIETYVKWAGDVDCSGQETYFLLADEKVLYLTPSFFTPGKYLLTLIPDDIMS